MKRIIAVILAVACLASSAHAVTRYTYNPGGHKGDPVKVGQDISRTTPPPPVVTVRITKWVFNGECLQLIDVTAGGTILLEVCL